MYRDRATFSLDPSETPKPPKRGACTQCKGRKVKCTYKEAASACQKCISAGLEHSCTQIAGVMAPDPSISRRPSRFSQSSHKSTSPCLPSNAPEYAHQSTTLRSHDRIRESLSEGQGASSHIVTFPCRLLKFLLSLDHYTLPTIAEEQLTEDPDPIISFQSFIDLERMQPQASSDVSHDDDFGLASTQFGSDTDDDDVLGPAIQPSNSPPMRPKPVRLGTERRAADHAPGHPDSQAPASPQDYDHDPSTCGMYYIHCPFSHSLASNIF
jgi:Fungal Zn(2)-Cys(6) binuclear cluster domain